MNPTLALWLQLCACAGVITVAGARLSRYGDIIADKTGLFNIAILAIDDLFLTPGPLLSYVSPLHAISAASAVVMTGVVIVGLLYRPRMRLFRAVGWVSVGLFTLYLLNSYVLFLHSE
jgi:cation:H+ antiporter